eukprot:TRINITY_DN20121_c0_g1_i1.p1 TRINITY_DN20121_c0_g1~~TRINITY_DN20121_c0_g1_i1.p1  ORF type:complete len:315 (-),score=53.49 TRINITY_DN20121_c0_g1_i1:416-1231(-)
MKKLGPTPQFGKVYVRTVMGPEETVFRRLDAFQLGPLLLRNVTVIESDILATMGFSDRGVAGLCGFDVFFPAVVEIEKGNKAVSLYDPATYRPSSKGTSPVFWQDLQLLYHVPCVQVEAMTLNPHTNAADPAGSASPLRSKLPFLLIMDTGARGVSVILHSRAELSVALNRHWQLALPEEAVAGSKTGVTIGGLEAKNKSGGTEVGSTVLHSLTVGYYTFEQVPSVVLPEMEGGVDMSEWVAGILCGDFLERARLILDYSRSRFCFSVDSE